jgi:DNA-binding response OmpR family regulator
MASRRILYVGRDYDLLQFLSDTLKDCEVIRCPPSNYLARLFIGSEINYSLFVLDEKLRDTTGAELEKFARSLSHRERTPVIIFKKPEDFNILVETIIHMLTTEAG